MRYPSRYPSKTRQTRRSGLSMREKQRQYQEQANAYQLGGGTSQGFQDVSSWSDYDIKWLSQQDD